MKKGFRLFTMLAFVLAITPSVFAAETANQLVTFNIGAVNEVSVSGDPGTLEIVAPPAGDNPLPVTDNTTTLSYSTNSSNKRITCQISADMPTGVTLQVNVAGGTGNQILSSTASNVVSGISKTSVANATITYTLAATNTADPADNATRTVTYTMTAD